MMNREDETFTHDDFDGPPPLERGAEPAPGYAILAHLHRSAKFDVYDLWSHERACRCVGKTQIPQDPEAESPDETEEERAFYEKSGHELAREGELLLSLTHPHVARAYEVIKKEGNVLLVTETITGQTLSHLIDNASRRLPISEITHLGLHLCSALHYLHGRDLLHLDLKPSNVVAERGMAKILDLSIARTPGRVKPGHGTLHYLSPEQAAGDEVGPKSDVWGLGATLYDAITGTQPFHAGDDEGNEYGTSFTGTSPGNAEGSETGNESRAYEQLERRAVPVGRHRRVPKAFGEIIDACLDPDPRKRPDIGSLIKRLEAFAVSCGY